MGEDGLGLTKVKILARVSTKGLQNVIADKTVLRDVFREEGQVIRKENIGDFGSRSGYAYMCPYLDLTTSSMILESISIHCIKM